AYVLALGACRPGGFELYNVGATGASVRDILAAVRRVTGREVPVVHNPPQPEVPVLIADTTRIRGELGWTAERSRLDTIITDTWTAMSRSVGALG
ncbi:MAG: NAD-dependent epimerase/dehydratase family protein, partial [Actinocrinis sp.]